MQCMSGERMMVNWVTIEPQQTVPRHQHEHEQAGLVIEGEIALTIGNETRVLHPGNGYVIPSGLPHAATAGPEGCLVVDIFAPPREDYLAMARAGM
jgi:quercetin dioxygenase-like cupin family protein